MRQLLDIQKKLIPDALETMAKRYRILQYIRLMQPIGRRSLSSSVEISERVLRAEVEFLKAQGLLHFASSGMSLTDDGAHVLDGLEEVMREVLGLKHLEQRLAQRLQVANVTVVPGDSEQHPVVKREMGLACVSYLKNELIAGDVVAVTGGTTVARVADMMSPGPKLHEVTFVPARGGLGEQVENQANTISSTMAKKAGANYRLLHVPDHLSEETYQSLIQEPTVKEVQEIITSARIVIHGIGEAIAMANRRNSSNVVLAKLEENHAVGEAFGYYFDKTGNIIHRERTIGLHLNDVENSRAVISVAGGASKAGAIESFMNHRPSDVLITDEACAKALLQET
ncbi:sugar-binding transcriptional regulator [Desertibacillus haloalkaliphilus]|uniref:sugar-binding transcriptional regulator n=1 Tax=Desertibacillus haloalkaliphilus TaxID=1328930 RepID=UPI001C27C8C7|nr:sugar-binding domain-containing protein [Desertibacillus haloalkaliphilus]MBU8906701.1 hypothetical protein [Desertibacillus haloalkaliphilus]